LIAAPEIELLNLLLLTLGGFAVVGASNAFNQVWETQQDGLMGRTQNRPLPAGRMTRGVALMWAVAFGVAGIAALAVLNTKTAVFGALSLLIYVLIYTPLKAKSPWAVLVGAVPGAIPFMLGWVAATGNFGLEPGVLICLPICLAVSPLLGHSLAGVRRLRQSRISTCFPIGQRMRWQPGSRSFTPFG